MVGVGVVGLKMLMSFSIPSGNGSSTIELKNCNCFFLRHLHRVQLVIWSKKMARSSKHTERCDKKSARNSRIEARLSVYLAALSNISFLFSFLFGASWLEFTLFVVFACKDLSSLVMTSKLRVTNHRHKCDMWLLQFERLSIEWGLFRKYHFATLCFTVTDFGSRIRHAGTRTEEGGRRRGEHWNERWQE